MINGEFMEHIATLDTTCGNLAKELELAKRRINVEFEGLIIFRMTITSRRLSLASKIKLRTSRTETTSF